MTFRRAFVEQERACTRHAELRGPLFPYDIRGYGLRRLLKFASAASSRSGLASLEYAARGWLR